MKQMLWAILLLGLGGLSVFADNAVSVADATGAKVTITNTAKLLTVGGAATEIVYALGLGDRIVATDISSLYPPEKVAKLPKVGYVRQLSAEGLLSLNPSLIISTEELGPPAVVQQLRRSGIPLLILPSARTLATAKARVEMVAKALRAVTAGQQLIAAMDEAAKAAQKSIAQAQAKIGTARKPRVMFVLARGAGTLMVSGSGTEAAAMLQLAGGDNAIEGFEGYRPLTPEAAVSANPDLILMTTMGLASLGAKGVGSIPALAQTTAVKQGRVVALEDLYLLGFGPRLGQAIADLASRFYPNK